MLQHLEKQQNLIQEVLEQIKSLQELSLSLSNLFSNTGKLSSSIKKAFNLLNTLNDEQKNLGTDKVELRLEHLELKIRRELSYYLELISTLDDLVSEADRTEKLQELMSYSRISEFKRKVSLTLAYRVLLFERGALQHEFNLDVAPDLLTNALKKVDQKKHNLRKELTQHFSTLRKSILSFVKSNSCSKEMASALYKISDKIESNVLHIKSEKPSDDLPASLLELETQIKLVAQIDQSVENDNPQPLTEDERKSKEASQKKQGLFGRVNVWLNTPDSTTWKDTKDK